MTVEEIRKYRTSLHATFTANTESFEKNSLFLSTGLLAFSITFIKDIVKIETAEYISLLFVAWSLIIISIALMIIYFLSSAKGSDELWKIVDDALTDNRLYDSTTIVTTAFAHNLKTKTNNKLFDLKKKSRCMRNWSLWSFFSGVVVFAFFVSWNLNKENSKPNTIKIINKSKAKLKINTNKLDTLVSDSVFTISVKSL